VNLWRASGLLIAALALSSPVNAEDLRTISGRVYKNASVLREEPHALIVAHKFGVVKIPMSDLSPEMRQTFNAVKAVETRRQVRAQEEERAAERAAEAVERIREQKLGAQRAAVDVDERDQAEAEEMEVRIQRRRAESARARGPHQRYRLRGEVIGTGADCMLVLCESEAGAVSRARQELEQLRESPFTPPKPSLSEVLIVTGLHRSLAEGDSVDLRVESIGTRNDCRTATGAAYSGRFRAFRAIE
jgi:hypothetical protein